MKKIIFFALLICLGSKGYTANPVANVLRTFADKVERAFKAQGPQPTFQAQSSPPTTPHATNPQGSTSTSTKKPIDTTAAHPSTDEPITPSTTPTTSFKQKDSPDKTDHSPHSTIDQSLFIDPCPMGGKPEKDTQDPLGNRQTNLLATQTNLEKSFMTKKTLKNICLINGAIIIFITVMADIKKNLTQKQMRASRTDTMLHQSIERNVIEKHHNLFVDFSFKSIKTACYTTLSAYLSCLKNPSKIKSKLKKQLKIFGDRGSRKKNGIGFLAGSLSISAGIGLIIDELLTKSQPAKA